MQSRFSGAKPKSASQIIRRLLTYLQGERKWLVLSVFLMLAHSLSSLSASYMIRPMVNAIAGTGESIVLGLCLMGALYLASMLSFYGLSRTMLSISQRAQTRLRKDLFEKMQRLPLEFYDKSSAGDLMSRFVNDIDSIGEMLNTAAIQLFSGLAAMAGTLALMYATSVILALVASAFIPLSLIALKLVTDKGRDRYRSQQAALGALNGYIEESIAGQKAVKAFCREELAIEEFSVLNTDYKKKQVRSHSVASLIMPLTNLVSNLSYVAVACVGVLLVALRNFDVGGVAVFMNYARQFGRPLNELSGQMNSVASALAGAERVFEVLDASPEMADAPGAITLKSCQGRLDFHSVSFGYIQGRPILNNISFSARKGEKTAFVGSTGAGKTTVASLVPRFYDIWEGSITLDGVDIRKLSRASLRENIAVILQDTRLSTGTIMENIRYGRLDATDEEVVEASKAANAHAFIERLKDGYFTMLDKDGGNLSQGQRQLISIARAALSKAPVLIMDEAASSVDARSERLIEEGLKRLFSDRTTIVIAHRLSSVMDADMILVMEQGEIIERGRHETLASQDGRYQQLLCGKAELA
jgi:ATP-binding cassette subfamily B protein